MYNKNKNKNKTNNNSQVVKGKNKPRQDDESPIKDDRFSKLHFDPRFQKLPKNETKVKIDNRFSRMFTDKNFNDFSKLRFIHDLIQIRSHHNFHYDNIQRLNLSIEFFFIFDL